MGRRFLTILGAATVVGVGVQAVNSAQSRGAPFPVLPDSLAGYDRRVSEKPEGDVQRDSVPSLDYSYDQGSSPPVRVSIARADTLNAYRAATRYLLDADGRIMRGQEGTMTRPNDRIPIYNFMIAGGRKDAMIAVCWTQTAGEDPSLDPLDAPGKIVESMMLKKPVFVCSVWIPLRADIKGINPQDVLQEFAGKIDQQIKAMK